MTIQSTCLNKYATSSTTLWRMVTADVLFSATGVTNGSILTGIKREPGWLTTETLLMRSKTGSVRRMTYKSPLR